MPTGMVRKAYIYAFAAANIILAFISCDVHITRSYHIFEWNDFIDFKGPNPFQSRMLPFLIGRLAGLFYPTDSAALLDLFEALDFLSVLVCAWAIYKAVGALSRAYTAVLLAFFLFWWQVLVTFDLSNVHYYYYPYDMASMAIIAVALYLIVAGAPTYKLFIISFIGMLNRETAILIPFFFLAFNYDERRAAMKTFYYLFLLCVAVKAAVMLYTGPLNGSVSLWHEPGFFRLFYNLSFLSLQRKYLHTLNFAIAFGGLWALLFLKGGARKGLSRMMYCFIPYLAGMMFVGNLSEIRIYGEFIPLLTLVLADKVSARFA